MKNPTPACVPCCPSGTDDSSVHGLVNVLLVGIFGLLNVVFLQRKKGKRSGCVHSEDN